MALSTHVWEGWTVGDFIEALQPQANMIMSGRSWLSLEPSLKTGARTVSRTTNKRSPKWFSTSLTATGLTDERARKT